MLIHRDAFVVNEITTDEVARYFVCGAMVDAEGRTVATNGHVLVRFTSIPSRESFPALDGVGDVLTAEQVLLSRDDIKAALATLPKSYRGGNNYLAIVPDGISVTIATAKSDRTRTVQFKTRRSHGTFPAYEKILEPKKKIVGGIVLDAKFLEAIGRMARQVGARSVTFSIQTPTDPAFFTAQGENGVLDGVIMPMRS